MDTTDREIKFDEDGVCNHCKNYDEKEQERQLEKLNRLSVLTKLKEKGCILGLSGGVDSSYCYWILLGYDGINPHTFSFDNGLNEKVADENVAKILGKRLMFNHNVKVDPDVYKELQVAFLGLPNAEIPTDHILMALTYRFAIAHKCKYIISGGNLATESVMPRAWSYPARDLKHIKAVYRASTGKNLTGVPTISLWQYLYYRFIKRIRIINLLDYFEYNREKAIKELRTRFDYKDYGDKHCESRYTKWYQNHYLPQFFGIDKRKAHYSSLILSGQMTREKALERMKEPLESPKVPELDGVFIVFNSDGTLPIKSHSDYPTGNWLWELLSKTYRICKI